MESEKDLMCDKTIGNPSYPKELAQEATEQDGMTIPNLSVGDGESLAVAILVTEPKTAIEFNSDGIHEHKMLLETKSTETTGPSLPPDIKTGKLER